MLELRRRNLRVFTSHCIGQGKLNDPASIDFLYASKEELKQIIANAKFLDNGADVNSFMGIEAKAAALAFNHSEKFQS